MPVSLKPRLGWLTAASLLLVAGAWWLSALGHPPPRWLSRVLVLAAAVLVAIQLFSTARRLWKGAGRLARTEGRLLAVLATVALLLALVGIGHEIGGLPFADEGVFLAQAQRINEGQLLKGWFVYPHLLFYLDAFALWLASLAAPVVTTAARLLYGVEGDLFVASLVTRAVTATLAGSTVVPVFLIARRLAGTTAAAIAGALLATSPIFLEIGNLNLGDVPAGFFATVALAFVAALVDEESTRGYLGAGIAAGLAAGSKYPAGTVAVAIAAVWIFWRLRNRRRVDDGSPLPASQPFELLWAALAALVAFLVSTPSLLAFPRAAAGGGSDVLFGVRLYAQHGWPGVVHASNLRFYGGELAYSFGFPALLLGASGLFVAGRDRLRRLAWMLPFPVLFLTLLVAMKIAVRRNLMPVLPILCAVLAVGIAAWIERLVSLRALEGRSTLRRLAAAAVAVAALALPVATSAGNLFRATEASTREAAARWIGTHVPPGAHFIQESYTPELGSVRRYFSRKPRFAFRVPREEMEDGTYDFLLLASGAYGRFLRPEAAGDPSLAAPAAKYRELLDRYELVQLWQPSQRQSGPEIRLYRLDPNPPHYATEATVTAADAWPSDDAMRASSEAPIQYSAPGQWSLFRAYLAAGAYRLELSGEALAGRVRVVDRTNQPIAEAALDAAGAAEFTLPRDDKFFLYLELDPGAQLEEIRLEQRPRQ